MSAEVAIADTLTTEEIALPEQLIHQVQTQGYLLVDDLLATMPEIEDNVQLEAVLTHLVDQGLEIYSDSQEAEAAIKQTATPADRSESQETVSSLPRGFKVSDISVDEDPLNLYLKEMTRIPLLTYDQEVLLAKQIERGRQAAKKLEEISADAEESPILKAQVREGLQARTCLIKANTRLVVSVAKRYLGYGVPLADLIQEGNLGLIRAVKKFDYRRGYKFSTYATWWIRQAVTRTFASQGRNIRLPVHLSDRVRKIQRVSEQLEQSLGRKPTPEEVAAKVELTPSKVCRILQAGQYAVSLESPLGEDGEAELSDIIEDKGTPPPLDTVSHHLLQEELEQVLSTLSAREAKVLTLRFGLYNGQKYTLAEIGEKLGLTRERVRQIENRALRRLRHPSRSRPLRSYLD
jgi:RNA polymerase primary sigma factor